MHQTTRADWALCRLSKEAGEPAELALVGWQEKEVAARGSSMMARTSDEQLGGGVPPYG